MPLSRRALEDAASAVIRGRGTVDGDERGIGAALGLLGPELYQMSAQQSAVAMYLVATDGRFLSANPAALSLFGRTETDLLTCTLAEVSHPEDLDWSTQRLVDALEKGRDSYRIQKRYVRGDGGVVIADVTVSLLRDEAGLPLAFFASAFDDTARVEASRRADEAGALLRASVDTLLDPWVLMTAVRDATGSVVDFEYTEANREACRHNHLPREQLIGSRLLGLFPGHRGDLLAMYARVLDDGEPLVLDDYPFPTNGELRWFDNRAVKVADDLLSFTWRDVTEAHVIRDNLTQRATTDPLTGLLNRAGLQDAVHRLIGPDRRSRGGVAVFYLDLDGLTQINNTHGHPAGDQVLRAVADRMAGVLRADDVVARVGGDEFVVLAPGTDDEAAGQLAVKIAHAITRPVRTPTASLLPTVSIGAAVGGPDADLEQLVTQADAALLKQKRALYEL